MENELTNRDVDKKYLCILLGLAIEMRHHQRLYFAYRLEDDKRKSIAAEKRIDLMIMRLKGQGYKPILDNTDQKKLF